MRSPKKQGQRSGPQGGLTLPDWGAREAEKESQENQECGDLEDTVSGEGVPLASPAAEKASEMNMGISWEEVLLISLRALAGEQLETKPRSKWA